MEKCKNCYHRKVCIDGANYKNSENCRQYKDKSLIMELQFGIGDAIYIIINESERFGGLYIKEEKIVEISTSGRVWTDDCFYDDDEFGKRIFLSREEAERALEESEKK